MTKLPQSLPQQLVHVSVTPDAASDQTHPRSHRLASHPQHTNLAHGRKTAASPVSPVFVRVHATGRRPGSFHICSRPRSSNAPASLCNQACKNHSPRSLHAPTSPVTSPETTTAQPSPLTCTPSPACPSSRQTELSVLPPVRVSSALYQSQPSRFLTPPQQVIPRSETIPARWTPATRTAKYPRPGFHAAQEVP